MIRILPFELEVCVDIVGVGAIEILEAVWAIRDRGIQSKSTINN